MTTSDAAISAGEKGQEPQHALHMFQKLPLRGLLCKGITYDAAFSAGEKGQNPHMRCICSGSCSSEASSAP